MPPRIPDNKRAAILTAIRSGQPRNEIARQHGVAGSTVGKIAAEAGLAEAFDRAQTKKATEAAEADHHARLVKLGSRMAGLSESILASFEAMTPEEWARVSPHSRGIVLGIATDKARDLGPRDGSDEAARSMIGALANAVDAVVEHMSADDDGA